MQSPTRLQKMGQRMALHVVLDHTQCSIGPFDSSALSQPIAHEGFLWRIAVSVRCIQIYHARQVGELLQIVRVPANVQHYARATLRACVRDRAA